VADLDTRRLILVLNMLGSSHDGEKLAALARAEAMLKAAGRTWGDLVGSGGRSAGGDLGTLQAELQAQRVALARERAAFETEKALWATKQKQWHDSVSKDQQERMKRQHEEDLARHRAAADAPEPGDDPRYGGDPDDAEIDSAGEAIHWENFKVSHYAEAMWIMDNLSWDFAASLFAQVKTRGSLSAKQMDAIHRGIERAVERQYRRYNRNG
jgi:hypothetical protein